ncbi:hypothetical protein UU5_19012 [Rhodanobacter sp. 115]|nr:hypothetical protein UU5_19012 [Rhodanobacter sp. 115]
MDNRLRVPVRQDIIPGPGIRNVTLMKHDVLREGVWALLTWVDLRVQIINGNERQTAHPKARSQCTSNKAGAACND